MLLCCSAFPPSPEFLPYLTTYLNDVADNKTREFHDVAETCLKRIRRVRKYGARRLPPATPEIQSIKVRARAPYSAVHTGEAEADHGRSGGNAERRGADAHTHVAARRLPWRPVADVDPGLVHHGQRADRQGREQDAAAKL